MRKIVSTVLLFTAIAGMFVVSGCNKDKLPPELILLGDNPMEIALFSPYSEPGFTADDETDGLITDGVTVTGTVDINVLGTYTLTYTSIDAKGNTSILTRDVVVKIMQENYLGSWTVGEGADCPITWTSGSEQSIAAGTSDSEIVFNTFYGLLGGSLIATISGQTLTIPPQNVNGAGDVAGTGTINNSANSIVLSLTRAALLGDEACTLTYTK